MQQVDLVTDAATDAATGPAMEVSFRSGERYEIVIRGHRLSVDQPVEAGGHDDGPNPTELFVASLASCVAYYAGRYLTRHGYSRDGLQVSVDYDMATDRPARVAAIRLAVRLPAGLPAERIPALTAVISHCTVHNSLTVPPAVVIDIA
jgi:putative redox protein